MPFARDQGRRKPNKKDIFCGNSLFCAGDGAWKEARKLDAPINSPSIEICPIISPDGKYLFFISQRGGESHVWWVKAGFIERMRNQ